MRQKLRTAILLASITSVLFTGMQQVYAVDSASIGISPAYPSVDNPRSSSIFIRTIKPGESADDGVRVVNYSKEPRTVELRAVDTVTAVDGSFSCRQDSEKRQEVGKWTKLASQKITLAPESSEVINFTITMPRDVTPGEHGGCITAQDDQSFAAKTGSGIQLGFRSAIRIAIRVPGDIKKALALQRVDVTRAKDGNYLVSPVARNSGNVSVDVKTRAQLVDLFGRESPIQTADYPIMRDTTTGWAFTFKRPYWGGVYRARTSVSYNANPNESIGEGKKETKKLRKDTGYFVMIPAWPALAAEVGIVLFVLYLPWAMWRRKHHKRKVRTQWESYEVREGDTIVALAAERGIKWRRLAKMNKIKAPYIVKPGQTIPAPPRVHKKDWIVEDTPIVAAVPPPEQPPVRPETTSRAAQPPLEPAVPVATSITPTVAVAPPTPMAAGPLDWAPPRGMTAQYDEYGEPIPDWREGADDEEIEKIEHIDGALFASRFADNWAEADQLDGSEATTASQAKKKTGGSRTNRPASKKTRVQPEKKPRAKKGD